MSRHRFVSAKSDGADATLVQPGDWNTEHDGLMMTNSQPTADEIVPANYGAFVIGLPLVIANGHTITLASGGVLSIRP